MKRAVIVFGLILGVILCINMFVMVHQMYTNPEFKGNDVLGYTLMVVMFSMIFFGVRDFRNKHLGGVISFGKALTTGIWIALLGCTLYVVVWLFYYYLFVPDFLDVYVTHVLSHTSDAELASRTEQMNQFKSMYDSPLMVAVMTYLEVLPVGLIVALVSALILKRKVAKG
ncbi:MAG: DUF4199 domain-containing protein [Saprospiraceae bacterium]|nr:DUF4199 domain-containing protein [Saprospiraceae bacterium]MCB9321069.1 DUF4199 domain-containing protein [Lewinellaceae bacterium]